MMERTILLDGFSKTFAMTGWRLGYGIFPGELVPHIGRLIVNSVSCTSTFSQRAAIQALTGPRDEVNHMLEAFATRRDLGVNHSLFIWHAPDLFGPWIEHAANPVKTDSRSARPGGTPFVVDGVLYRPSQDCSRAYGGRLVINRVDVLTPTAFEERPIRTIEPQPGTPYQAGMHTLSRAGSRTLIDGNHEHLVAATLRHDVEARMRRLRRRFR